MPHDTEMPDIAEINVRAIDGKDVKLKSLWARRRVVLAFLRHFG
jgi:hypothetical protein